jgi:hypothetical protein
MIKRHKVSAKASVNAGEKRIHMFYSILFPTKEQHEQPRLEYEPEYFKDLNLDQVFLTILTEEKAFGQKVKNKFGLEGFFYTSLDNPETVTYRQEILRELEDDRLRGLIAFFTGSVNMIESAMEYVHDSLTSMQKWRDNYLTRGQLLDCVERYCEAVSQFSAGLSAMNLRSEGLRNFTEYVKAYLISEPFLEMREKAKKLREGLAKVEFCMLIKFGSIRVRRFEGQEDLVKGLLNTFEKFKQEDTHSFNVYLPEYAQDLKMEANLLSMVAAYYTDIFSDLYSFCNQYFNFEDETIVRFTNEIHFYLSWLGFIAPLKQNGLQFCYPKLCGDNDYLFSRNGFDIALASRSLYDHHEIVTNDFEMQPPERIIVVTGANQGGKTTFARAFGQAHHLASIGLCVPGSSAALYLCDNILTHFEREEDINTLNGKLQDDLIRLHALLQKATKHSIFIVNEIFVSTTLVDALLLGGHMMDAIAALGTPSVVVTFLDELALHGPETVSMMSIVSDDGTAERTFKIMRKPPDGLAYAMYLANKHGLTYEQLIGRLRSKAKVGG